MRGMKLKGTYWASSGLLPPAWIRARARQGVPAPRLTSTLVRLDDAGVRVFSESNSVPTRFVSGALSPTISTEG